MRKFIQALLCLIFIFGQAPGQISKNYKWDIISPINKIPPDLASYPAVIIKHHQIMDIRPTAAPKMYLTQHKRIHLNSQAGIEKYNKVYIPMQGSQQLVSLDVRAIDPTGKLTLFNMDNLKELKNVEGFANFKIFAVEGLTVGGEMEYIYTTVSSTPRGYGRFRIQEEIPIMKSSVLFAYWKQFDFKAKSYNGLKQPTYGKSGSQETIELSAVDIPAYPNEPYSTTARRMYMDFKLEKDLDWKQIADQLVFMSFDKAADGKIKRMLEPLTFKVSQNWKRSST